MKIKDLNKGKVIVTVTIGIISFILTFIIFMQFKFVQHTNFTSIKNLRDDEIREEIALLKTKYESLEIELEDTYTKIDEYEHNIENNEKTLQLIDEELKQNKLLLGQTNVYGEGVIIYYEDDTKKVDYNDLLKLVNELNLAGAEAISINDQRVVNQTEIVNADSYIYINGERTTSPFIIKAIGNKKYLEAALTGKGGLEETAKKNDKKFRVESSSQIQIQKFNGKFESEEINIK